MDERSCCGNANDPQSHIARQGSFGYGVVMKNLNQIRPMNLTRLLQDARTTRRQFVATGAAAGAFAFGPSQAIAAEDDDLVKHVASPRVMGSPDAPIHVAEYYSMTCGHCANFHNDTFPKVKAKLIDEGIVRFEMRPFPLDGLALRAHALVRALPENKFFPLVKMLLAKQPVWVRAEDPVGELQKMARLAGVGADEFNSIMNNRALLENLVNQRQVGIDKWKVGSTPSFVVNDDTTLAGNMSYEQFAEELSAFGA